MPSVEIIASYSHKGGRKFIETNHPTELREIEKAISVVDADRFKTKISEEKTMKGRELYSPIEINKEFKHILSGMGWTPVRLDVSTKIPELDEEHKGFREMDLVKNKVGLEIQFGKYAFMIYNVAAKMTIFNKQGIIDSGVEVVPMRRLTDDMSTGVSSFEQMKTDLEFRGEADIDIPVLILGIHTAKLRPKSYANSLLEGKAKPENWRSLAAKKAWKTIRARRGLAPKA